jgi:CRISPR/Cas system CSM-associated protein Csm4 (group 5 of RAMP superfamily)
MKKIKKFSEQELREYVEEYKDIKNSALRRYRSRSVENKMDVYREYLDAKSMISNIHYKLNHGEWLYNDLPDSSRIGFRKIIASGDKSKIGKLVDGFGRIVDETQQAS